MEKLPVSSRPEVAVPIDEARAWGLDHADVGKRITMFVGLALDWRKWVVSAVLPLATSVPAGALTWPPKPPGLKPRANRARTPNTTTPMDKVSAGRWTRRPATLPHQPSRCSR